IVDSAGGEGVVAGELAVVDGERALVEDAAATDVGVVAGERAALDRERASVGDGTADLDAAYVAGERAVRDGERALIVYGGAVAERNATVAGECAVHHGERARIVGAAAGKLGAPRRSAIADAEVVQHDASVTTHEDDPHREGAVQSDQPATVNRRIVRRGQCIGQGDGDSIPAAPKADGATTTTSC